MFYCVQCACHPSNFEATQTFSQLNLYINHICHGVQKLIISVSIWKVWEVSALHEKEQSTQEVSGVILRLWGLFWADTTPRTMFLITSVKLAPFRFHLTADTSISRAELFALKVPADDALQGRAVALSRPRLSSKPLSTKDIPDGVVFGITH